MASPGCLGAGEPRRHTWPGKPGAGKRAMLLTVTARPAKAAANPPMSGNVNANPPQDLCCRAPQP